MKVEMSFQSIICTTTNNQINNNKEKAKINPKTNKQTGQTMALHPGTCTIAPAQ